MPNTAGIVSRKDRRADADAEAVRRLRQAGAIVLGVTNVPEAGMWMETYNHVYGRTNNPWDVRRTSGGSSGGEAALVSAGGSPLGLATDMGGSIRIPASFCGVVGHKPTGRLVPNTGCWPAGMGEMGAYMSPGPITRRVCDVMPVLRCLAGPDGADPVVRPWTLGDPDAVRIQDVTVYPVLDNSGIYAWPSVRRALEDATTVLRDAGARIESRPLPRIRRAFAIWGAMLASTPGASYRQILTEGAPLDVVRELLKLPLRRSQFTSVALFMSLLESLFASFPGPVRGLAQAGRALQAELEAELGPHGVLLHPPYSRPAPRHRAAMLTPLDFTFAGIFNVLEFPVTQVPFGFDRKGLPLGIQVVGRRGADHVTLAVARVLEAAKGGWKRSEPVARPAAGRLWERARGWLPASGAPHGGDLRGLHHAARIG
jgi:fatty acid amide hydrolase 2